MEVSAAPQARDGRRYARTVLVLLFLAYTMNFADRTIISAIGQAIKDDLKITDTQLGLLGGLYFALLYTLLGIPIARMAEHFSRVKIITAALIIWSGFTALCGAATSYAMLAATRFGVGVGEAGLSPPAHSLLSDYFPAKRRASALSIYSLGVPAGVLIGAAVGGWIAQQYSWRLAFAALGLPGVLLAVIILFYVKEPARGQADAGGHAGAPVPIGTFGEEFREVARVAKFMVKSRPLLHMMLGITFVSFASYGGGQFAQPYWARAFGLNYAQVGLITGFIGAGSQAVGIFLGGFVTDRLARGGTAAWYGIVPAIGIALAFPFIFGIYTAPTWQWAAFWMLFPGMLSNTYMGPTYGVLQNLVPVDSRATATAVLFFVLNLIAMGGGPPLTGWLIDHLAAYHFLAPGGSLAQAVLALPHVDAAAFQAICPGGVAPAGGASSLDLSCRRAVELATREGSLVAYGIGLWGALHYLISAFSLKAAFASRHI